MLTVEVGAKKYLIRLEHRIVASKFFNFGFNHTQVVKPVLAVLRVFCFGRPLSFLQEWRNCWLVFSSLSCWSRPFKHGLICGQKLPVSAGALWWRLTVNGDSTGVWAGAKSGEKPGATLPWAGFFFYLFPLLPRPAFPLPGHGAPVQPSQRRQPPQQQPPALQTQALFAPSNSIHLQQVWNILKTEAQFLLSSLWCCLLHLFGSTVVFCVCFLGGSSTPVKPQPSASSVGTSSSSILPPPPSASVSLPFSRGSGSSGPLRPPSRTSSGALFTSSPGLPPPPPLLQGTAHPTEAGTAKQKCFISPFQLFMGMWWLMCCKNKPNPDFPRRLSGFVWGVEEVVYWWTEIGSHKHSMCCIK